MASKRKWWVVVGGEQYGKSFKSQPRIRIMAGKLGQRCTEIKKELAMIYVFIDESGDFGHKRGSKNMVVACLVVRDYYKIKRIMRGERHKRPKRYRELSELKASESNEMHRSFILKKLAVEEVRMGFYNFETYQAEEKFWDGEEGIIFGILVKNAIINAGLLDDEEVHIIIDRRHLQGSTHQVFNLYLEGELRKAMPGIKRLDIVHEKSHEVEGLRAVDYVAYALYRFFEHGDNTYIELILDKLIFPQK